MLLFASGVCVVYYGLSEDVISYFCGIGFECFEYFNLVEFLIDFVSVDVGDGVGSDDVEVKSRARIECIVDEWVKYSKIMVLRVVDVIWVFELILILKVV